MVGTPHSIMATGGGAQRKRDAAEKTWDTMGEFRFEVDSLHVKQLHRLKEMKTFYTPECIQTLLIPIITQNDSLSLRVLDWLVTNYAKKNNVVYTHTLPNGEKLMLNVYSEYKSWLRNYRRRNFDPFRRRTRVSFTNKGKNYETTVGQLNFLYWAHKFGILQYTREHLAVIEQDMIQSLADVRKQKDRDLQRGIKRKRRELSCVPQSKCSIYTTNIRHKFDDDSESKE